MPKRKLAFRVYPENDDGWVIARLTIRPNYELVVHYNTEENRVVVSTETHRRVDVRLNIYLGQPREVNTDGK